MRRLLVIVPFWLFVTGIALAAEPICKPECYPVLTCSERLDRFTAHGCPLPLKRIVVHDCDIQDREIGALKEQARARAAVPLPVPAKCAACPTCAVCPPSPAPPAPKGAWLVGPTGGYADGPFAGIAGGYQFPKGLTLLGSVTRHKLDGGGVWYTPPPCPHEESKDPLVPYPGETVTGIGVTVLWRLP
jgi:hypothetical protein